MSNREREGYLTRVAPAAYRVWGVRRAFENRAMSAVLSARGPAVVSHRSAAWLHGLEPVTKTVPGFVDVTVPRHRRPRHRAGVTFYETSAFELTGTVVRNRIPVTGVARTILDCCRLLGDPISLLDDALRQRLVAWDELWECYFAHKTQGRRGLNRYRAILCERDGNTPPAGEFARRMGRVLTAAGLPQPVYEYPITVDGHDYRLDVAWPELMTTVECNGDGTHITPRAFRRDPAKRNRCELAGWTYLEFTWWDLVRDPAGVIEAVRRALDRFPARIPA
ncbi:MAG: hypothetical protein ACRDY7_11985 [Acidimicrobiia bacterium]